jgi:hypothetical protein
MPHRSRFLPTAAAMILGSGALAGIVMATASGTPAEAAISWPSQVFAPYVDTGLSNTTLTTVASEYGTQFFTLAFVDGAGCQWSLPNQSGWQSQISSLQAEGGDVSISFGGYTVDTDGDDLGATCSSASAMAAQVESVVTTMGVTHLDFDIESNEMSDSADLTLTAQALAMVRAWDSSLVINYTIPVLPSGLTSQGVDILDAAVDAGFTPNVVNIMTMDYGTSGTEMGTAAEQAIAATASQLESIFNVSSSAAYGMLGVTPMIGQNDTSGEIFTTADASSLESYAAQQGLSWLSMWSEGRDNDGCPGDTTASSTCSGVSQTDGQFTTTFQAFTSGSSSGGGGGTPPPTGSCDPAWSDSGTYVSGDEVSYNGDNWTANQWNYDEVPGGASGAWDNDGAC